MDELEAGHLSFDKIVSIFHRVRFIAPFDEADPEVKIALASLYSVLGSKNGCGLCMGNLDKFVENDETVDIKQRTVSCSCGCYLQYGCCLHSFCWAKRAGLILQYPLHFAAVSWNVRNKKGRPSKAKGGQALRKD